MKEALLLECTIFCVDHDNGRRRRTVEATIEVFFFWGSGQSDGPDNLSTAAAGLPDQDRKPDPG